ncbi:uncharacterized protein LOC114557123 isoform X2 [Perca flavescens]|uniref:uncharacterized protein LOC114557123 isoform X2 n=1 Tax=Perca flavescens TaxID=8167 RepID=UPI00106E4E06|nr:uncharacterized protein LOC114557123 isoform X2 [Perca flavescens]
MSGKKQLSILSFSLGGKPPKKARIEDAGQEKVAKRVSPFEEETQEEMVQVEEEETVEEMARVSEETIKTKGRKVPGAATYNNEWTSKWPFITVGSTSSYYWCSICCPETSWAHQGVRGVTRHIDSKGHQDQQQALKSTSTVKNFYLPVTADMNVQELKTRRAEVKVAIAMVQHNVSFAVADHFSPVYRECFKDSPTAQNFKSFSTKTTSIINQAVAPHYRNELVMKMRENPFTPVTDGSNDTDEKQPRFRRLTEVCLLNLQATFPVFSTLNLLLQRGKASIFQLYEEQLTQAIEIHQETQFEVHDTSNTTRRSP